MVRYFSFHILFRRHH